MAIDFPNTPANNDIYTVDGVSYIYNEPKTQWKVYTQTQTGQDLASVTTNIVPASNVTYSLGTANNAWSDLYVSGNTIHLGATSLSVTAEGALQTSVGGETVDIGGGIAVVANNSLLPLTGNKAGDQLLTSEDNRLYIWNGVGWYSVALLNQSPNLSVSANTVSFDLSGTPVDVTLTASDPEGSPLTFGQTGTNTSMATVTQSNNVFTFTPTLAGYTGFTTTFSASDGINVTTANVVFEFDLPLISASTSVTGGLSVVNSGTQLYIPSAWQTYTDDLPDYLKNTWGTTYINDGDSDTITVDAPARLWYLRNTAWAGVSMQNDYTFYEAPSGTPITGYTTSWEVYYKDVDAGTHTIDTYSAMWFITAQDGTKIFVKNGSTLHPDIA